ncbi:hypothetical protein CSE16_08505 [Solibacillus sp. R5-41]|uniref:DUF6583 family protein n=1 Tax=Solibacillus sp. R5-41 TaxID=2048654 RepID=UPI000C126877|nr:DUF6583 family protein [Solibacillus sp. R5-41]ATP40087.1 hypothetical protein CSE16_08505 [Solibacillus sp. R5-41]
MKKSVMIGIIVAMLAIGGGATAFFIFNKSGKQQYFLAETKTMEKSIELFQEKYANEYEWYDKSKNDKTEYVMDVSASPGESMMAFLDPQMLDIIENSSIKLTTQSDMKKGEIIANLDAKVMDVEFNDFIMYLTAEKLLMSVPFLKDTIQLNDKDFGKVMRMVDPSYEGTETLGLDQMTGKNTLYSDEMAEYLKTEYLKYFYEELPEEAFTVGNKEEVKIGEKKLTGEKVTMKLTEQQVKDLFVNVLEKAKKDDKLEELIKGLYEQSTGMAMTTLDIDFSKEMDTAIDEMIQGIKDSSIPNGLTSEIWHQKDLIVQRHFEMKVEEETIVIDGKQSIDDAKQIFEYEIGDKTDKVSISGDLSWKDQKALDTITVKVDGDESFLQYKGDESLKGDTRTFSRTISFEDGYSIYAMDWSGEATHEKDQMKGDHQFAISMDESELLGLNINQTAKVIKEVKFDAGENVINIGEMDQEAFDQYINETLYGQAEKWFTVKFMEFDNLFN